MDYVPTTDLKSAANVFGHQIANLARTIFRQRSIFQLIQSRSSDAPPEEAWRKHGEHVELSAHYESQHYRQDSRKTRYGADIMQHGELVKPRPTAVGVPGIAFH